MAGRVSVRQATREAIVMMLTLARCRNTCNATIMARVVTEHAFASKATQVLTARRTHHLVALLSLAVVVVAASAVAAAPPAVAPPRVIVTRMLLAGTVLAIARVEQGSARPRGEMS